MVERLHERGDDVLVVHRGRSVPDPWVPVGRLLPDRRDLGRHANEIAGFAPEAIIDTVALTGSDVDAVLPALPQVPTGVLSSQDVYEAHTGLRTGQSVAAVPLTEDSALRADRYPYRGLGLEVVPDDYDKLDVEERWLARGAVVLRLPLAHGPHDWQHREEPVLRRLRAGRARIPVGAANLLWTRGYVDDLATGVLSALDTRAADGLAVNLGEPQTMPIGGGSNRSSTRQARAPSSCTSQTRPCRPTSRSAPRPPSACSHRSPAPRPCWAGLRGDPATRIAESVRWHLDHPPTEPTWSDDDAAADDAALAAA